jgi:hypothetical protein
MIRDVARLAPTAPAIRPPQDAAPSAAPPRQAPPPLSPALRVDAALNLLVVEIRDREGEVVHSIPSPQQLDAYRSGAEEPPAALDLTG